jgi:hypothetical protein
VCWMLGHRSAGAAWMQRSSETELEDNAWRVALRDYAAALVRLGLRPRFITPDQLANGPPRETTLILPHAIALSDQEVRTIVAFAAGGGRVIADTPPGRFDEHGRRRAAPSMPVAIVPPADLTRAVTPAPAFRVEAPNHDVDIYLYRSHGRRLLALQRRAPEEKPETVAVELNGQRARDIASGHDYGRPERLTLTLDPITPVLLAIGR